MTSRVLYSNSDEISSLIESVSGWTVSPLDDLDRPGDILLFDTLFYRLPEKEWTVSQLLEKRPEWKQQILPLLKARNTAYLFYGEWCAMDYQEDEIEFRPYLDHPMTLAERDGLLSTQSLTFGMQDEIQRLIRPAKYARTASEILSRHLKRPVDFGTLCGLKTCVISWRGWCLNSMGRCRTGRIGSSSMLWTLTRTIFVTSVKRT